jgi:4-amino-4-deoxy-L-arabinose transferase-like glycosyltransferase
VSSELPLETDPAAHPDDASAGALRDRGAARRLDPLWLALLAALVFLPGISSRDVWSPDEPRYAEVAREMLESGNFLVPHLNERIYDQKPPLFFWTVAASGALFGGVNEAAVRLPSALAAIGCTLLVFAFGDRFGGRRVGWLSAVLFLTSGQVLWQGRIGQIDMVLTFFVAGAMWCFARGFLEKRAGFYRAFFAVAGLATLAKGPVGLLPPLLAILVFLLVRRDRVELRRLRPLSGLAIWLLVVAAWLVPAGLVAGADYFGTMTLTQNLTRYAAPATYGGTSGHLRPWYHYLETVPGGFIPWSALLLVALWTLLRNRRTRQETSVLLPVCWAAVTLVFFSLSPGKRSVYVMTMFPGLALVMGIYLDRVFASWPRHRTALIVSMAFALAVALALCVAIQVAAGRPQVAELAAAVLTPAVLITSLFALGAALAVGLATAHRPVAAVAALAGSLVVSAPAMTWRVLPGFDAVKSSRPFVERVRQRIGPTSPLVWAPEVQPAVLFYLERAGAELSGAELSAYVEASSEPWVITQRSELDAIPSGTALSVCEGDPGDRRSYLLLGNCADGEPLEPLLER